MDRTQQERILDYLWSVSPGTATNNEIRDGTGIKSHQQVYLLTRRLMGAGYIRGERRGHEWVFGGAPTTFLVFGNDRHVPELWLKCYGGLVSDVSFYFLTADGALEQLTNAL